MTKFLAVARRERLTFVDVGRVFAPALPGPEDEGEPAAVELIMPFGKHRGRTLGDIARTRLSYLRWMAENLEDEDLRDAAEAVLEHFTGGGR